MRRQLPALLLGLLALLGPGRAEDEIDESHNVGTKWAYYEGRPNEVPQRWGDSFPTCQGPRQSPINIDSMDAQFTSLLQDAPISLLHYDEPLTGTDVYIYNNGHTVTVRIGNVLEHEIGIVGGGLPAQYILAQFHWHWGSNDSVGSEHTYNGKRFPAEMHFVHINRLYVGDVEKIESTKDGIAVVGVFIEVGEHNDAFDPVIEHFEATSEAAANETSLRVTLPTLRNFLPQNTADYYRYEGSLTTPPCSEAVIWTVMRDTIKISQQQLDKFRTLKTKKSNAAAAQNIVDNYRPVQPLNGRNVYVSYATDTTGIIDTPDIHIKNWGYYTGNKTRPSNWGKVFAECAGQRQSPIHIRHTEAVASPLLSASQWELTNYDTVPSNIEAVMENNGHTAVILVGEGIQVSGGGLPSHFRLLQFHLHWGRHNSNGSEHILNGKQYPAELHLVHSNMDYGQGKKLDQIEANHDGLAVLGVFVEVGEHNAAFDPVIEKLDEIKYVSDAKRAQVQLTTLRPFLPEDLDEFYRYYGSLTTPPCKEIVLWTVFKNTIQMSQEQLEKFRTKLLTKAAPNATIDEILLGTRNVTNGQNNQGSTNSQTSGVTVDTYETLVIDNFRPIQQLNQRVVRYGRMKISGCGTLSPGALTLVLGVMGLVLSAMRNCLTRWEL